MAFVGFLFCCFPWSLTILCMITPDFLLRISGPPSSHRWLGFPPSAIVICGGSVRVGPGLLLWPLNCKRALQMSQQIDKAEQSWELGRPNAPRTQKPTPCLDFSVAWNSTFPFLSSTSLVWASSESHQKKVFTDTVSLFCSKYSLVDLIPPYD